MQGVQQCSISRQLLPDIQVSYLFYITLDSKGIYVNHAAFVVYFFTICKCLLKQLTSQENTNKNQKKEVNGEEKGETEPSKIQNPNMQATENIQCQGKFQLLFQLTMGHQNKVRFGRTESRLLEEGCRAAQSS